MVLFLASISLPVLYILGYSSCIIILEMDDSVHFTVIFQNVLAVLVALYFHRHFTITFSISMNNVTAPSVGMA